MASRKANYDFTIKIMMLGESSVGKSSIVTRFAEDKFTPVFLTTIGVDFKLKIIDMSGKRVRLQIWDTAGQEKYRTINADISYWIKSLDDNCKTGISKILVGNKLDLDDTRQVTTEEGKALADKHGMFFFETSAKSGTNVDNVFMDIAGDIIQRNPNIVTENAGKTLRATTQGKDKTGGECC